MKRNNKLRMLTTLTFTSIFMMLMLPLAFAIEATYFSDGGVESTVASIPDTKNLTISFWIRINDSSQDGTSGVILSDGGGFSVVEKAAGNGPRIFALDDPGTTTIVNGQGTGAVSSITSTDSVGWKHIIMSISTDSHLGTNVDATFRIYANDTNETSISGGVVTIDGLMNWDAGGYTIGSNQVGTQALMGCLAEVWIDDIYLDLDQEVNRRKFIGADGGAVNLSEDGSGPTGTQPLIYFTGGFQVNNGSLADPDVNNGVQTECENAPPESVTAPGFQPPGEVNVSIVNPFDGSFQGSLVYVNYTQAVGSPEIFDNASLLVNGSVNQTQFSHLNFTVTLDDGHHNLTVQVFSNGSTSDQDSVEIIVDTINPFDNLNTIIPSGTEISSHANYTITATNSNLVLHNVTIYSALGDIILSQEDTGVLGTTNDITINLDNAFFVSNAPGTFNVTSREEDNASLSGQTSILLTILPPSADTLLCNDATCSSLTEAEVLDNITVTCTDISLAAPSVLVALNGTEIINDNTLDVTIGNDYVFFENLIILIGDYNVTGVCAGDNGEDRITEQWTVKVTELTGFDLLLVRIGIAGAALISLIVILVVCSSIIKEFRKRRTG
ncbi:MAG: hypothetical protein GTO02_13535 [Candidatus Dadabacteria bacterium]|nr:hypothetical protein [Candidatus Dadabacteria bacterium]